MLIQSGELQSIIAFSTFSIFAMGLKQVSRLAQDSCTCGLDGITVGTIEALYGIYYIFTSILISFSVVKGFGNLSRMLNTQDSSWRSLCKPQIMTGLQTVSH